MIGLNIRTNFPDVMRQLDQLHDDIAGPATVRAVNRSIEPARPEMARAIAREFNLSVSQARETLVIKRARYVKGQIRIEAELASPRRRGRSLNLIHFAERKVTLSAARKRMAAGEGGSYTLGNGATVSKALQLRFKIKRGGPYRTIPGAFIANQGRTVFIREGKSRLPIKALQTIDVAQMFNAKRINLPVRKSILERFPRIAAHEIAFYTRRFNERRAG